MPQASPGDFCLGNVSLLTTSPTHWVTSPSDMDEPSSRHARTAPSFVMTNRIFTSPEAEGSFLSPAFQHACTLAFAPFIVFITSFGAIWWDASQGSSPAGALMLPESPAGAAEAAGALDAAGAALSAAGAADEAGVESPPLVDDDVSSASFAGGVLPPHAATAPGRITT